MVGTLEQVLDARERRDLDHLTEFDLKMIGTFVRIEIPMTDINKLRRVSALLRDLADLIDSRTSRKELSARTILMELKMDARVTAARIKDLCPEVFRKRWAGEE